MKQVTRALKILEVLGEVGPLSLADVSDAIETPRASTHRLLTVLGLHGYVQHLEVDALYQLGPAVQRLAARNVESRLVRLSGAALTAIRAQTGETVNLAVVDGSRIVYAATLDGAHQPRMSVVVGSEVEPHATALGKAILYTYDQSERERLLPAGSLHPFTERTITSAAILAKELKTSAERGYAVEIEESTLSATCIAVPIVTPEGRAIAAISISGVSARLPVDAHAEIAADVRRWTDKLSRDLFEVSSDRT